MHDISIRTALCSVTDKSGLEELARCLAGFGCRILSSGGTANYLKGLGISVTPVSEITGFPEILDGRVKTLHPRIHGALLAIRGNESHERQLVEHDIQPIDMVIVNLYPFVQTVARPGRQLEEVIENIDIGGPSMIRSAAKNFEGVAVVTDPQDYASIMDELRNRQGALGLETRQCLARKAFETTAEYDRHVSAFMAHLSVENGEIVEARQSEPFPQTLHLDLQKVQSLRYGENPHQRAAFYRDASCPPFGLAGARILQGKEISYNNLLDLDAAVALAAEFDDSAAIIIKHTNPCGAACGDSVEEAYRRAYDADPVSAYGSIVAVNCPLDAQCARFMSEHFIEALVAPGFSSEALEVLGAKKNLRLLELADFRDTHWRGRSVAGGWLLQDADSSAESRAQCRVVSKRQPTDTEWAELLFAWRIVKHVKSNAIVLTRDRATVGVGAGQMSRVESVEIAVKKGGDRCRGTVLASDAFFPFRDGLDAAARAGVTAVIEPGGSRRDAEVIGAADEQGLALVFTGVRHFRH
jgi:phosphoribosylaminoimidazolecarboxamide formyltransferase / IMP cyclohydrolase